MIELDKELVDKVKNLKMEFRDTPQPELLIKIPNRDKDVEYEVEIVTGEFTSLCPLNLAQPDYATISIFYKPGDWTVELKSLKFYLASFRQVPIFHEQVPAVILKALANLLNPKKMEVFGQFTIRGGIQTAVRAVFPEEEEQI